MKHEIDNYFSTLALAMLNEGQRAQAEAAWDALGDTPPAEKRRWFVEVGDDGFNRLARIASSAGEAVIAEAQDAWVGVAA